MFFVVCVESNTSLSFFLSLTICWRDVSNWYIHTYIHAVTIEHRELTFCTTMATKAYTMQSIIYSAKQMKLKFCHYK